MIQKHLPSMNRRLQVFYLRTFASNESFVVCYVDRMIFDTLDCSILVLRHFVIHRVDWLYEQFKKVIIKFKETKTQKSFKYEIPFKVKVTDIKFLG